MRFHLFLIVGLLCFTAAAQAQIAAPKLNSTSTHIVAPTNPSLIPFGGPSHVAGGYSKIDVTDVAIGGAETPFASGDGMTLSARLTNETVGIELAIVEQEADVDPAAGFGPGTFELPRQYVGLGFRIGEDLGIGLSQESGTTTFVASGTTFFDDENTIQSVGVAFRLADYAFLGAMHGSETVAEIGGEVDRTVQRFGIGVYSADGDFKYHVEVYMENLDPAEDIVSGVVANEEENSGYTVEVVVFGGLLLGVASLSGDETTPAGIADGESKASTVSIGWIMEEGLTIVADLSERESIDPDTSKLTFDLPSVTVGWRF